MTSQCTWTCTGCLAHEVCPCARSFYHQIFMLVLSCFVSDLSRLALDALMGPPAFQVSSPLASAALRHAMRSSTWKLTSPSCLTMVDVASSCNACPGQHKPCYGSASTCIMSRKHTHHLLPSGQGTVNPTQAPNLCGLQHRTVVLRQSSRAACNAARLPSIPGPVPCKPEAHSRHAGHNLPFARSPQDRAGCAVAHAPGHPQTRQSLRHRARQVPRQGGSAQGLPQVVGAERLQGAALLALVA